MEVRVFCFFLNKSVSYHLSLLKKASKIDTFFRRICSLLRYYVSLKKDRRTKDHEQIINTFKIKYHVSFLKDSCFYELNKRNKFTSNKRTQRKRTVPLKDKV